jgi:hypothetical protein
VTLALPDEPRWVEAHGIATDPDGWRRELDGGFALGHDAARLIVIADASSGGAAALAAEYPHHAILTASDELAAALRTAGRKPARAILHTAPAPGALPDVVGAHRLPDDAPLDHVPPALVEELIWARARGPIWTVHLDGNPVAFAYAPWRSARWFDVSVDTLVHARQLGLGTIAAAAMIRDERTAGREPVWGADEGNLASRRLAAKLGMKASDEIWVAPP